MRAAVLIAVLAAAGAGLQQTPAPSPLRGNGLQSLRPLPSITSPNTLSGLKPVADPGPQCRARCAQESYACDGDGEQCQSQLRVCQRGCSPGR